MIIDGTTVFDFKTYGGLIAVKSHGLAVVVSTASEGGLVHGYGLKPVPYLIQPLCCVLIWKVCMCNQESRAGL